MSKINNEKIQFKIKKYNPNFINKVSNIIKKCPYCDCTEIIKYGVFNEIQRYRCKNNTCRKTFSKNTLSPFKYSKKFKENYKKYHDLYKKGLTIRECANQLNITIVTSFFWRHRFLYDLKSINYVEKLSSYAELSRFVIPENFKGDRKRIIKERDKISIVNGLDTSINIISIIAARNHLGFNELKNNIMPRIDKKAYAIGILDGRLQAFSNSHNERNKLMLKDKKINIIDKFYSVNTKRWLKKFNGVATKYIDHYLSWRAYEYKNNIEYDYRLNNEERKNLKINLIARINSYISWKNIKKKVIPV